MRMCSKLNRKATRWSETVQAIGGPNMTLKRSWGNSTVEFPIVVLIFLVIILFPLIDLGTLFLGSNAVYSAARVAAVKAARAPSFQNDVVTESGTVLSAINQARQVAASCSTGGVKIDPNEVEVSVLTVPLAGGAPEKLVPTSDTPIDTTANIYQIQVTVIGRVSPLVTLSSSLFGNVPGLTGPLVVTAKSTATFEHPGGLTG